VTIRIRRNSNGLRTIGKQAARFMSDSIERSRRSRKIWIFRCAAMTIPLALGFVIAEVYFRIHDLRKSSVYAEAANTLDEEFGWYPRQNFSKTGQAVDSVGQSRQFRFTTGKNGFRRWPATSGGRARILIVGDSFTQAERIDDAKTYYARLAEMVNADIFAFGCSGYGTLQEWMVIDRHFETIKPDLIVLQVCSNDFVNASVILENASRRHNNGLRRPYPRPDGAVAWDIPRKLKALSWLSINSRFLFWLVKRVDQARAGFDVPDGTFRVTRPILPQDPLAKELERTRESIGAVFARIRHRVGGDCRVVLFAVDQDEPYATLWKGLAAVQGFDFWGDFDSSLKTLEDAAGKPLGRIDDSHWNEFGHEKAAEYLKPRILQILGGL